MFFFNIYSLFTQTLVLTLVFIVNLASFGQGLESPINATHSQTWYANQVDVTFKKINRATEENQAAKLYEQYFFLEYGSRSQNTGVIPKETENRLKSIFFELKTNHPNSFECQHLTFHRHQGDIKYFENLKKAASFNRNQTSIQIDYVGYYESIGDPQKKKQHCIYLKPQISQATLEYNYNVLMSLGKNAILITNGISDTYPIWVLQEVDNIRKDVTVLNTQLLENEAYRDRKFKELELSLPKYNLNGSDLVDQIIAKNKNAGFYLSLTCPKNSLKNNSKDLFIQGLAYKTNPSNTLLESNWQKFKSDYRTDLSASLLNTNYLIPLISLHNHYKALGDVPNQNAIYSELRIICKQLPNGNELLKGF